MIAAETITVKLIHSVAGLLAEIDGLPVIGGPEYFAKARSRDLAAAVLLERYPELVIKAAWSSGDTSYVFRVEHS